jgi:hypothetical protein
MRVRTEYARVWIAAHGPIPKDADGRSYDIHHINGNHGDNRLENLKAIPITEHYDIHYKQKDWNACRLIALRMKYTPSELSAITSELVRNAVKDGTHVWVRRDKDGLTDAQRRVKEGRHHLSKRVDGTSLYTDRINAGKHHFQLYGQPTKTRVSCVYCKKVVNPTSITRFHQRCHEQS